MKKEIEMIISKLEGLGFDIIAQSFFGVKLRNMQWRILMALIYEKGGPVCISKIDELIGNYIAPKTMNIYCSSINNAIIRNGMPKTINALPNNFFEISAWLSKEKLAKSSALIAELKLYNIDIMKSEIGNVYLSRQLFLLMMSYIFKKYDVLRKKRVQTYKLNKNFEVVYGVGVYKYNKNLYNFKRRSSI